MKKFNAWANRNQKRLKIVAIIFLVVEVLALFGPKIVDVVHNNNNNDGKVSLLSAPIDVTWEPAAVQDTALYIKTCLLGETTTPSGNQVVLWHRVAQPNGMEYADGGVFDVALNGNIVASTDIVCLSNIKATDEVIAINGEKLDGQLRTQIWWIADGQAVHFIETSSWFIDVCGSQVLVQAYLQDISGIYLLDDGSVPTRVGDTGSHPVQFDDSCQVVPAPFG